MMDTGVPLGVRIYDLSDGVDFWVTKWVEDFSFRHTVPGGCASCTLKLHYPNTLTFDPEQFGRLFYRVQIVDLRSAEVQWEGRIEDPAQQVSDETWELGVLGSQVVATDINQPVLYADNTLDNWRIDPADAWDIDMQNDYRIMQVKLKPGYLFGAGSEFAVLHYNGFQNMATSGARITMTYVGVGPGAQAANFDMLLETPAGNIDITAFSAAQIQKSNVIPTDMPLTFFTSYAYLRVRRRAGTGNYTIAASEEGIARFKYPKVQAIRLDVLGNAYLNASDYPGDYLLVWQVVQDVVGRFLNGGFNLARNEDWQTQATWNSPEPGSVRGTDAYVDTGDINQITNLWWDDAVNAKTILDTMMLVQRNAYWAIWDSGHRLSHLFLDYQSIKESQFRFEWATWPTSWNYIAPSDDGMAQQLSGEELFNSADMNYEELENPAFTQRTADDVGQIYGSPVKRMPAWKVEELERRFTRHQHFTIPDAVSFNYFDQVQRTDVKYLRQQFIDRQDPQNSGTITIRRPMQMVDSGDSDGGGFMGMINPWEIKPGKLIKIRDLWPMNNIGNLTFDMGSPVVLNANNGFESGATSPFGSAGGTFTAATDQKYSGTYSGKIVPTGAAADVYIATPWGNMVGGESYRARAQVRCAVARNITIRIDFYDATPTFIDSASTTISVAANTWTYFEISGIAPNNATQGPALVIMSGTPAASNIMWVDEFYYEKIPSPPRGHENTIFRVAATEYSTGDNSCKMELDQLPKWSLSKQIVSGDAPGKLAVK